MKKILITMFLTTSILFAIEDTALNYLQNYNNSILVKESVSKLNNLSNSIGSYIVNTGGNPSLSSNTLSLTITKDSIQEFNNMSNEDFHKLDNSKSDVSYSLKYDSSNKIPIGLSFTKQNLFGTTNLDLNNEKVIAYLNSNGIVYDKPTETLTKYFNQTTMSTIKQEFYILKDNSNISIIDVSDAKATSLPEDTIAYSPDGKGGFLIYQKKSSNWNIIGEPEIQLAIDSSDNLNNIKLPIGDSVIVLNDGGKAIQYTMQSSVGDGGETSNSVWNKTTGSIEKNYYFNPIKISDIAMDISAELQQGVGEWDGHTFLKKTYIDTIQYQEVYDVEKNIDGTDKLDLDGNVIYKKDEGGQKIMIAQSLSNIIGHVKYEGGLGTGGETITYGGFYHSSNIFGSYGGRLYFEIPSSEYTNYTKPVEWIGSSFIINVNSNDSKLPLNDLRSSWPLPELQYHPCSGSFGGGALVYNCDVWIGLNINKITGGGVSLSTTKTTNYKNSGITLYKVPNAIEYTKALVPAYTIAKNNYDNCLNLAKQYYQSNNIDYYTLTEYSNLQCNSYKTTMDTAYQNIKCLDNNSCNTQYACHHDASHCVHMNTGSVTQNLSDTEFNMTLGCYDGARISYYNPITKKKVLKKTNEKVIVNVKKQNNNTHLITFGSGINESMVNDSFDITYIDINTFGYLQCIKRNATSNYGESY